jgi:cob(I)alamin adenosyltransferase
MSIGKAKSRLARMERQLKQEKEDREQCGITQQHIIYLEQQIDAYKRVIADFENSVKAQRANDD